MAEEHGCEAAPEGHILCANNCGFFGSSSTLNLCSKCYRDFRLEQDQASTAKSAFANSSPPSVSSEPLSPPIFTLPSVADVTVDVTAGVTVPIIEPVVETVVQSTPNRCLVCRKRMGLTGFKCKCGTTFCGVHRYPEKHGCSFDFKSEGREAIARDNPVVVADKLRKI